MTCTCTTIQAADPRRHFKECPERAKHEINLFHTYEEENAILRSEVSTLREELRKTLNLNKTMFDNLTSVQVRCTELLNEARLANGVLREVSRGIVLKGWTCPNPICGVFNGEEKERLVRCRCCETPRPT